MDTKINPEDYSHSPVHYAVVSRDYEALSSIISRLPQLPDPTQSLTESDSIAQERIAEEISAVLDSRDIPSCETPLHLAVSLNDAVAAETLASAGANVSVRNCAGWNPIQEARCRGNSQMALTLGQIHRKAKWARWRRRLPRFIAALHRMRDFYMEISFHFESSMIPFIGRITPSDTYKIWKREGNLRADTSLAGFDGMRIQRENQSFIFLGDGNQSLDIPCGSLLVVNRDRKKVYDALEKAGAPMSDDEVTRFKAKTTADRLRMDVAKAEVVTKYNWRGQEKTENVGEWKAKVYDMHNVVCRYRSRETVAGKETPKQKEVAKSLTPLLWLTEKFPLKTEELLPLLDILANKVKAVRRMRELLTTTFPPGTFPVKIGIPVIPAMRVVITFSKFVELQSKESENEKFFTPSTSPVHNSWFSSIKGKGRSVATEAEVADPFAIPDGYKWVGSLKKRKKRAGAKGDANVEQNGQKQAHVN